MRPLQHCRVSRVLGCGQGEGTLFTVSTVVRVRNLVHGEYCRVSGPWSG